MNSPQGDMFLNQAKAILQAYHQSMDQPSPSTATPQDPATKNAMSISEVALPKQSSLDSNTSFPDLPSANRLSDPPGEKPATMQTSVARIAQESQTKNTKKTSNLVKKVPSAEKKTSPKPRREHERNPRRWTDEEDRRLRQAVAQFGDKRWKDIAKIVGTRDNVQCLQRWRKSLRPGLIKGPWKASEDELLRQKYREKMNNSALTWSWVASFIDGRSPKQCRERWQNFLDSGIKRGNWTPEEDEKLQQLYEKLHGRWAMIARELPGRTENSVKVRFQSIDRYKKKAMKAAIAGKTGTPGKNGDSRKNTQSSKSSASRAAVKKSIKSEAKAIPAKRDRALYTKSHSESAVPSSTLQRFGTTNSLEQLSELSKKRRYDSDATISLGFKENMSSSENEEIVQNSKMGLFDAKCANTPFFQAPQAFMPPQLERAHSVPTLPYLGATQPFFMQPTLPTAMPTGGMIPMGSMWQPNMLPNFFYQPSPILSIPTTNPNNSLNNPMTKTN